MEGLGGAALVGRVLHQDGMIDTSEFASTRHGLEYYLCLLNTFGIMFSPWSLTFNRGQGKDEVWWSLRSLQ
jgi:uncharacterized membrane protein YecN with MAPEG domain